MPNRLPVNIISKTARFLLAPALVAMVLALGGAAHEASADTTTLVPVSDIANPGGWQADDGTPCGGGGTVCSSRIDEDVDSPNDADYIRAPLGADNADLLFHISDPAPGIVTEIRVRFRAFKDGPGGATDLVAVINDTFTGLIGTPIFAPLTTTPTDYSYTISGLYLQPSEITGAIGWVRGDVTNPAPTTRAIVSAINFDITYTAVSPNPELSPTCGLDIALVIDSSGSIVGPELDAQKTAFKGFVDAFLPTTSSELAVVDFDAFASVVQGFTNDPTALKNAIDSATTGQFTNWDDALYDARTLFPNRPEPDLIVFASDGYPNSIGGHEGEPLQLFIGNGPALNQAILEANAAKAAGVRIVTLGVGLDALSAPNLAMISSPDAVVLTDFDQLAEDLAELANSVCKATLHVNKFYDANANGINDDSQPINGWPIRIQNSVDLLDLTPAVEELDPGDYTVSELSPAQPNWVRTTPSPVSVNLAFGDNKTVEFGNVCLGSSGGLTLGFWSNKNGQAAMNDGGTMAPELALLTALNLRNGSGANFNPTSYNQFRSWLLSANATNMAYMLSAQMAAMQLNVEAGFVSGGALIYAPALLSYSVPGMNALGFISIGDLLSAANLELGLHGVTTAGSAYRAYQEALKTAIDRANNNLNFVQPRPCAFSFPAGG